jgi:hypothetical protein
VEFILNLKKEKSNKLSPKVFLEMYGKSMVPMKVGNVLYVTYFGSRARIQRVGTGDLDYNIEMWQAGGR